MEVFKYVKKKHGNIQRANKYVLRKNMNKTKK